MSPEARHEQLGLFEGLTSAALADIERRIAEVRVPAGATVFSEGERGDALYVVRSGLVDLVVNGADGPRRIMTVGPGETFGEQSLVTGHPRSASAVAQTGAVLGRLEHADFIHTLATEPKLGENVARVAAEHLRAANRTLGRRNGQTVVVWAADAAPLARVARSLAGACEPMVGERPLLYASGPAEQWGSAALPAGTEVLAPDDLAGKAVRAVREHALVLLLCAGQVPGALLDGADRVVVVGDDIRMESTGRSPVHSIAKRPTKDAVAALARAVCGRRIGLALGSGGIRGFAHAGVLRVVIEEKLPIDFLAGASAGAMAGALYLRGMDPRDLADFTKAMQATVRTGLPTFSFSPQAMLSGRRILTFLRNRLGRDTTFADLDIPYLVAATSLDTREAVHIDSGPLPEAVAASAAVPGVFPPVRIDGQRLVDGGASDPVPVRALRARGADIVIAVNVMPVSKGPMGIPVKRFNIPLPGLLETLFLGLDTIVTQIAVLSCQQADVVIEPGSADAKWYDVVPMHAYMQAGENSMREAMPRIRDLMGA